MAVACGVRFSREVTFIERAECGVASDPCYVHLNVGVLVQQVVYALRGGLATPNDKNAL